MNKLDARSTLLRELEADLRRLYVAKSADIWLVAGSQLLRDDSSETFDFQSTDCIYSS